MISTTAKASNRRARRAEVLRSLPQATRRRPRARRGTAMRALIDLPIGHRRHAATSGSARGGRSADPRRQSGARRRIRAFGRHRKSARLRRLSLHAQGGLRPRPAARGSLRSPCSPANTTGASPRRSLTGCARRRPTSTPGIEGGGVAERATGVSSRSPSRHRPARTTDTGCVLSSRPGSDRSSSPRIGSGRQAGLLAAGATTGQRVTPSL